MPRHLFFAREPSLLHELLAQDDANAEATDVKVPQWVHILPKPDKNGLIHSRDNRILHVDDLDKLCDRSNAALKKQKGGGPVDADHSIYGYPGGGPALGWAEQFDVRPAGLFAKTDWLDEGKQYIEKKLYRYTSSVVIGEMEPEIDEATWRVTWHITPDIVEGYALTNIPALTTHALFSQGLPLGERDEALQVLLHKMGLPTDASPTDIRDAWASVSKRLTRVSFSAAVDTPAPAPTPDAVDAPPRNPEQPEQPEQPSAPPPSTSEDVGEEPVDGSAGNEDAPPVVPVLVPAPAPVLVPRPAATPPTSPDVHAELAAARKYITDLEAAAGAGVVDSLLATGKITPAMKNAALKLASTPAGQAYLRELHQHTPAIVPVGSAAPPTAHRVDPAPYGLDPFAFKLAQQGLPAHEIARQITQRAKEKQDQ